MLEPNLRLSNGTNDDSEGAGEGGMGEGALDEVDGGDAYASRSLDKLKLPSLLR